jgi:hypothetical protein
MLLTSRHLILLALTLPPMLAHSGWAASTVAPSGDQEATVSSAGLRPQDSLWLISTRHLGCPNPNVSGDPSFRILRYDASGWQESDFADWLSDQREATLFYVHGNRVDNSQAFRHGRQAYHAVVRRAEPTVSIRFVVWSWPSDQICGPRRDVQSKAARTGNESYYLASALAQLPSDTQVSLFGFSFGARIISGSLHLLGGSPLNGYRLADIHSLPGLHLRAVLMAAAMDRDWWLPSGHHSQCLAVADQVLVQFNPCDPALKLYPRIDRQKRPQALGYTGFPWSASWDEGRVQQQNVSSLLGKTHDGSRYLASEAIMARAREVLLPLPSTARP